MRIELMRPRYTLPAAVMMCLSALAGCAQDAPVPEESEPRSEDAVPALEAQTTAALLKDDFETGRLASPPWTSTGDVTVQPTAARASGFGVRLNRGATLTATVDTTGKNGVAVSFDMRGVGLDAFEYVAVSWAPRGLSTFLPLGRVSALTWSTQKITLPASASTYGPVRVRFYVRASDPRGREPGFEGAYLDNFVVTSNVNAPGCTADTECSALDAECMKGTCDTATGQCSAKAIPGCVKSECTVDADCKDTNSCDGTTTCMGGKCIAGPATSCDDGKPCTKDSCSPTGGCQHAPNAGAACPGGTCSAQGECVPQPAGCRSNADCSNLSSGCTQGTCNVSTGQCSATPVANCCTSDAQCGDNNACNGVEKCVSNKCVPGTALSCDDGKACTKDSCNPATGCQAAPTPGASCPGGTCTADGMCDTRPPGCRSNADCGNLTTGCTQGTCNVSTGQCSAIPVANCCTSDAQCGDNNACNGVEKCVSNKCVPGTALSCDDAQVCTADRCNPASGCAHTINTGASCGNGNTCNATGVCAPTCNYAGAWESIQKQIIANTTFGCPSCHSAIPPVLTGANVYETLTDDRAGYVVPPNAESSKLYDALHARTDNVAVKVAKQSMPPTGFPAVPKQLVDGLREWIARGAPKGDGFPGQTAQFLCTTTR